MSDVRAFECPDGVVVPVFPVFLLVMEITGSRPFPEAI
jgi:hypothetical protein